MTFLTGFSFLGQGQNTAQAFITLKDWSERARPNSAEAIVADINRTFAPLRDGKISRAAAAADRQSRQFQRLQLPPAGPRPAGLCRADARERSVARRGRAKPGASGRLCRRPVARAANRARRRPREGRRARRDLRGDQQRHLDQSRLRLRQRLSRTADACSASSCRPTAMPACSPIKS